MFDFLRDSGWTVGNDYKYCWRAAAVAHRLPPSVAERSSADFTADQLLVPPPAIPRGGRKDELDPQWFEHMKEYQARSRDKGREHRRAARPAR